MKNKKTWAVILLCVAILLVVVGYVTSLDYTKNAVNNTIINTFDPLNAVYTIEDKSVTLAGGHSSDSSTLVFGLPVKGDLNNDGTDDAAFIISQNTVGSGTFFYIAAAINSSSGTIGTNSILLGDRIAPQNVEIVNGQIITNYADRKTGEPMTAAPSVGVSRYFKVMDNALSEVHIFSQVTNRAWKWVETKMGDGTTIVPKKTSTFTLHFKDDQTVSGTTDCNSFGGSYTVADTKLSLSQLSSTLMYCDGSQETDFLKGIDAVESYTLTTDNKLILQLKMDSGVMIFE